LRGSLAVIASKAKQSRLIARDKLRNHGSQEINNFEIAAPASVMQGQAQQKTLRAMTFLEFFNNLLGELMQCIQCKRPFPDEELVASICGSIMGDEHIDSYFLCPVCGVYTVSSLRDSFTGGESESVSGPVSKQEGDKQVALIRQCSKPWSKRCRCEAHRRYFNDRLD
jgi:hypothetical protein